jgi:CO/xanthine dehydrogenase FAD-binding subunit
MPCRLPDVEACLKGRAADPAEVRRAVAQGARDVRWVPREGLSAEYAADLANTVIQEAITEAAAGGKPV